jgi:polysaccharide biosynthesis protein PslH
VSADRGGRRLLVLTPFPPRLDAPHGGGRSVARLIQLHATRNRVGLLTLRRADESEVDPAVAGVCDFVCEIERVPVGRSARVAWRERQRALAFARGQPLWAASVHTRAFARSLVEVCADWTPDVVQAEFAVMGGYLPLVSRPARRVVVDHDPVVRHGGGGVARWRRRRFARQAAADAIVVFTTEDERALESLTSSATLVTRIPLAWRVPRAPLDPLGSDPPTVLFVGSFRHPPNVAAARRLAALLPELRRHCPNVALALVGEAPPADLAATGAIVTGWVDDVEPWLASAAVVAAPVSDGGGTRVKVVEALVAGKAVVGTPLAFEGLDVQAGRDAVVATEDGALLAAIVELLTHPGRRQQLGSAAYEWGQRLPTADDVEDSYESLYRSLEDM